MFGRATITLGIGSHSSCTYCDALHYYCLFMVALCNRETIYIFMLFLLLLSVFTSSPNLSGRRLDVYHTSTHRVALVRI